MPEQVGDAALLFDPKSDQEVADIMRRLWIDDELCTDLVERGRKQVRRCSTESFSNKLAVILKRFLSDIYA